MSTTEQLTPAYLLQRNVQEAVRAQVEQAKQEVVQLAVKEFEARVRKIVGACAVTLANYYSVERMGQDLVIKVRIGEEEKPR